MGRNKITKKKNNRKENFDDSEQNFSFLKSETKRAIVAVFSFAGAIFFILAKFEIGGPAGRISYQILDKLFGWGFYFVPVLLVCFGVILLRSIKIGLVTAKAISGTLFLLSLLGAMSIVGEPTTGGLVGSFISSPLLKFFDFYASLVFLGAIILISLLVAFDTHQILGIGLWKKMFNRGQKEEQSKREF